MEPPPDISQSADYVLRRGILSPMETLAQSVSTMAPTTTPAATMGNGTWLVYVLATGAIFLVGLCIGFQERPKLATAVSTIALPMASEAVPRARARSARAAPCRKARIENRR